MTEHAQGHGAGTDDHGHAEAEPDSTNVALLGFFLAITTAILVVAVWGLTIFFGRQNEDMKFERIASVQNPDLAQLRQTEQQTLTTYGVVDKAQGLYRIPIDRAMLLFVGQADARAKAGEPQRMGPPVPPPAAAPAPAAPAPAAPAPAAKGKGGAGK